MHNALEILQKYWKHVSFRYPQQEIIDSVLKNKDTLALLPTGGGKSICFQIPALMMPGLCIVVSPLIALIEDQVNNLTNKGIKAIAIIGGASISDIDAIFDNCMYGNYKFLYLSPERLQQTWILERIEKLKVNLIAIDEAHCISQWGHDFRPAYLQLSQLRELFPSVSIIALTASANNRVVKDICTSLKLEQPNIFTKSFYRENLIYGVYKVENKINVIEKILRKNNAPTIIYVRNRRDTQYFSNQLNNLGFKATFFHGGLNGTEKKKRLKEWIEEKSPIIVATNAFGMGIDKQNVKNVIHAQIPENIENYYQEAGRGGRDGKKSFATILISGDDIQTNKEQFSKTLFDKEFLKIIYRKLNNYLNIAYGEGFNNSYSFNFNAFCNHNKFQHKQAYNALQFLDRQGIIKFSQSQNVKTKLQFTATSGDLLDIADNNEHEERILLFILRYYQGIHEYETEIDLQLISEQIDEPVDDILKYLEKWKDEHLCIYTPEDNDISIVFNEPWEEDRILYRTFPYLKQQNELKISQFKSMLFYIENQDICKNKILLKYFDEILEEDCGTCSVCLAKKSKRSVISTDTKNIVLSTISEVPKSMDEISALIQINKNELTIILQLLLEENKIIINNKNQYIKR